MIVNKISILSFNIWGFFFTFSCERDLYILWLTNKKELFELVIWLLDVLDIRKWFWEVLCFYRVKVIMCNCMYHSEKKRKKKKKEFVNVKVLLTINTIDCFLLWTPYSTSILALQLIREQKNTKKVYWFMLMVSSTLLDNILPVVIW